MTLLRPLADRVHAHLHKVFRTPGETARLMTCGDDALRSIAQALASAWRKSPSQEERVWFGKIEALRRRLLESDDEVILTDYGAGSGGASLSSEEMYRGREVRRAVSGICRTAAKPRAWAALLFFLVRRLRPAACLELGTSLGVSAAYQTAALELNDHGRLVTIEGADAVAALAKQHLAELGLRRATVEVGRFQDRLDAVLRDLGRVDFAFIDGHHDERATLAYFEKVLPALSDRAVVVFDDIAWSAGMRRAWRRVGEHPRVHSCVDLFKIGMVVTGAEGHGKQYFKIAFP